VDTQEEAYLGVMERCKRRAFTREFKAETVRLVVEGGRSLPDVAHDLDLTESALREWCDSRRSTRVVASQVS
jgi:transposase-like protein